MVAISKRWPEPEARYRAWHREGESGGFRLGAIQLVQVEPTLHVANMIAQRGTRPIDGVPPIRYEALRECLSALTERAIELGASVHMPRSSCDSWALWCEPDRDQAPLKELSPEPPELVVLLERALRRGPKDERTFLATRGLRLR